MNDSFRNIREPGGMGRRAVIAERDKALIQINDDLDETEEHQRAKALSGIIEDVNGKVLFNSFEKLGVEQTEVELDLTVDDKLIGSQLIPIKREVERILGKKPNYYVLQQGADDSDHTLAQEHIQAQAQNPMNIHLQMQDNRPGIRLMNDIDLVAYAGDYLDEDESYLIPIFDDCCRVIYGPSDIDDYLDNAQSRYVYTEEIRKRGLHIDVDMSVLHFFTRPEANLRVNLIKPAQIGG